MGCTRSTELFTRLDGCFSPLDPPRFLCDEMLQGLGQWLRVAGYDTRLPVPGARDREVLRDARKENRWLLTCDRGLVLHAGAGNHVVLLETEGLEENAREITWRFDLDWLHAPFSRCKRCNARLLTREDWMSPVPIFHCPSCRQDFWQGSHVVHMRQRLHEMNVYRRSNNRNLPPGLSYS